MRVFRYSTWPPHYQSAGKWTLGILLGLSLIGAIVYGMWRITKNPSPEPEAASSAPATPPPAVTPPPATPTEPPASTIVTTNESEITIVAPMTLVAEDPQSTEIFNYQPVMDAVKAAVAAATDKKVKVKVFAPITAISGTNSHVSLIFDSTGAVSSDTRYAMPGPEFTTNRPSWYHSTISAKFGNALFP